MFQYLLHKGIKNAIFKIMVIQQEFKEISQKKLKSILRNNSIITFTEYIKFYELNDGFYNEFTLINPKTINHEKFNEFLSNILDKNILIKKDINKEDELENNLNLIHKKKLQLESKMVDIVSENKELKFVNNKLTEENKLLIESHQELLNKLDEMTLFMSSLTYVDEKYFSHLIEKNEIDTFEKYQLFYEIYKNKKFDDKIIPPINNEIYGTYFWYKCFNEITTHTYLMFDKRQNLYKIGIAKNVKTRYNTLKVGARNIKVIAYSPINNENELHHKYGEYRYGGEWFEFDEKIIENVINDFMFKNEGKNFIC